MHVIQCNFISLISASRFTVHCLYTVSAAAATYYKYLIGETQHGCYCDVATGNATSFIKNESTKQVIFGIFRQRITFKYCIE